VRSESWQAFLDGKWAAKRDGVCACMCRWPKHKFFCETRAEREEEKGKEGERRLSAIGTYEAGSGESWSRRGSRG